ncbi:hybrid sensor histidine kinase/response regulator [Deinococcus peraridilitoris]|uniref:histidine kinase n=1 Tax=Deinococcus peraridilitoris (strain DSM 19664 / LMG 22246 / CIP 109416 / KR-200) TaxID=937777 RepID=K9ZW38_DEIPD|nr:hybrid sensor histidine kinase/response regulator [Deinococcus peraridilitoris]AFZ65853.1 chemotaxis protein histidine kinase-like protein [Deinococcus peraridilitoris DSM 19664]
MTMDVTLSGDLFESFLLDSWDAFGQFEMAIGALDTQYSEEALAQIAGLSHRIRGTTALYGFGQMSRLAALAERLLEFRPELDQEGRAGLIAFFERLAVCLRSALERISNRRGEGDLGLQFTEIGGTALLRRLLDQQGHAFAQKSARSQTGAGAASQLTRFARENADVWEYFAPEAREHIELMRAALDSGDLSADTITTLFRSAHTLKGSSYMVGFSPLGDLGHVLEDVLSAVRDAQLTLDPAVVLTLGEGVDLAERLLRVAEGENVDLGRVIRHTKRKLNALIGVEMPDTGAEAAPAPSPAPAPSAASGDARATVRVPVEKLDALMSMASELIVTRGRLTYQLGQLSEMGALLSRARERMTHTAREFEEKYLNPHLALGEKETESESAPQAARGVSATVQEMFDELEFDSYTDLNIVARSVTEISSDLAELQLQLDAQLSALHDEGETLSKLARTLRGEVARARRVPFGQAVTRLKRWARTRDGGTAFSLDVSGENVEVDTFVLEAVVDPLLHLLNNSLVHGIEDPQTRVAAGKAPEGRISVHAAQHGPFLDIEVRDDGAGINSEKVREAARGRVPDEELAVMTDDELTALIFLPGFSTAKEVTAEAGRGVGMDVVASNIRRLGGEVLVRSQKGVGTTFTLRVPLTQQITETLAFRVGMHTAAFPTAVVRALRSVPSDEVVTGEQGERVTVEGESVRLLRLRTLWGYEAATMNTTQMKSTTTDGDELSVIVVETAGRRLAIAVDEFLGLEELAIHSGGPLLEHVPYVSGTTLSSAGEVVMLLDAQGIERLDAQRSGHKAWPTVAVSSRRQRLLLIDDSVSVRRVVARMLERGGFDVVTASDGYDALELLRSDTDFDAVLTDLEMPRVSGYEVIEEVRRRSSTAHLPVIVMTTRAGDKHQQLAMSLGANEYFSKPIDETRLIRRLAEITRGAAHRA